MRDDHPRSVRRVGMSAVACLLVLAACAGSTGGPPPLPSQEPPIRYVRTVAAGGEAIREPGSSVQLSGRLLTHKGKPVAGATVTLERNQDALFPGFCFFGCPPVPACAFDARGASSTDGRFFLEMCRPARDLSLRLTPPGGDGEVYLPLFVKPDRLLLPVLRLWKPGLTFDPSSGVVSWRELPARGYGRLDRYELTFRSGAGPDGIVNAMWFMWDAWARDEIDVRVLEDTSGEIDVAAHTAVRVRPPCRPTCSAVFRPSFTSGSVPYRGPGAPPSRGKPCFVGEPGRGPLNPCYLTDGRFFYRGFDSACTEEVPCGSDARWFGIDNGSRRRIDLVVARDCAFCRVFVSADGRTWREVPRTRDDQSLEQVSVFEPDRSRPVRYVRVTDPEDLTELSYW